MTPQNLPPYLSLKIVIGLIAGLLIGGFVSMSDGVQEWLILPGDIFIAFLKMIIVPLVLSSVILGVVEAKSIETLKMMSARLIPYFVATTCVAVMIGLAITSFIQPGASISVDVASLDMAGGSIKTLQDLSVPDRILNFIPINPVEAQLEKNMLQLIVLAVIIGILLLVLKKETSSKTMLQLCTFVQNACIAFVHWLMRLAPIAVCSLMIKSVSSMGMGVITNMGLYGLCVVLGLLCMFVFYLLVAKFVSSFSFRDYLTAIRPCLAIAFSTSSSGATMPVTLAVAQNSLKLKNHVSHFEIALGTTINMDGTALYQAVAALFLCQVFGIELSATEFVLLIVTTLGASIGTPGIPGVGLIVLSTILMSVGVPPEGIALILGVDRLLDMLRTSINVTGDLTAATVMNKIL
jgi:proton glutamate symport protein